MSVGLLRGPGWEPHPTRWAEPVLTGSGLGKLASYGVGREPRVQPTLLLPTLRTRPVPGLSLLSPACPYCPWPALGLSLACSCCPWPVLGLSLLSSACPWPCRMLAGCPAPSALRWWASTYLFICPISL